MIHHHFIDRFFLFWLVSVITWSRLHHDGRNRSNEENGAQFGDRPGEGGPDCQTVWSKCWTQTPIIPMRKVEMLSCWTNRQTDVLPLWSHANAAKEAETCKEQNSFIIPVTHLLWTTQLSTVIRANFPIRRSSKTAQVHQIVCSGDRPLTSHHLYTLSRVEANQADESWTQMKYLYHIRPSQRVISHVSASELLNLKKMKEPRETILRQPSLPPARTQSLLKQTGSLKFH